MYNRELSEQLVALSRTWPIISVTGPRQSGKTTLCKNTFPDYDYINLEHLPTRAMVEDDIDGFLNQHTHGLILDEAQHLPQLFSHLQVRVDEDKRLRYVLSGSSDFLMMQSITQSLAGRVAVKRLLPLSLTEIGETASDCTTDQILLRGFYPAVWGDGRAPKEVYESYYETYLDRDVRQIINVQNLSAFRRFVTLCAGRIGSEFNASQLSIEVGVSNQTISNWISILETSYTAFRLLPYYRNIGKRLTKMPKLYFYDVGFAAWVLGIRTEQELATHPLRGNLFENMIVVERMKARLHQGEVCNIFFYRDKSHEVDIVEQNGIHLDAIEVKSGQTFHPEWCKGLTYLQKLLPNDIHSLSVIYDGPTRTDLGAIPLINYQAMGR